MVPAQMTPRHAMMKRSFTGRDAELRHASLDPRGGAVACRTTPLRACLSRTLTRAPVAPGWRSRSDEVAFGGEELHEVTVAGCPELETPERDHASRWERIRNIHRVWVGSARHSWRSNGKKRENVTQIPYLARQLSVSRPGGPDPN